MNVCTRDLRPLNWCRLVLIRWEITAVHSCSHIHLHTGADFNLVLFFFKYDKHHDCQSLWGQRSPSLGGLHLFFQPVVVLDDGRHGNVGALHVEGDVSRRLLLDQNGNKAEHVTRYDHFLFAAVRCYFWTNHSSEHKRAHTLTMMPILLLSEVKGKICRMWKERICPEGVFSCREVRSLLTRVRPTLSVHRTRATWPTHTQHHTHT